MLLDFWRGSIHRKHYIARFLTGNSNIVRFPEKVRNSETKPAAGLRAGTEQTGQSEAEVRAGLLLGKRGVKSRITTGKTSHL